jgi:hypothetical protein
MWSPLLSNPKMLLSCCGIPAHHASSAPHQSAGAAEDYYQMHGSAASAHDTFMTEKGLRTLDEK